MAADSDKGPRAFRTIGEVSDSLGIPQHILRFWESRFSQLRPLKRSGNRRYYRPEDVELVDRINRLLNQEGYTIRGVQQLLAKRTKDGLGAEAAPPPAPTPSQPTSSDHVVSPRFDRAALIAIRELLADGLERTRF